MAIINQRKERTQKAERFERFSQTDICVAETQMKRDNTFREKRQNKKISLAFLSLSLQSFVSSVVAFGRRYRSYLKLISFFFKRSAFTTREEERRKVSRILYISSRRRGIVFLVFVKESFKSKSKSKKSTFGFAFFAAA